MNIFSHGLSLRARHWLAVIAGLGVSLTRLMAADEPAAAASAPAAPPAAAPAGTWYVFSPPKDDEVLTSSLRVKMLNLAKSFLNRDNAALQSRLQTIDNPFYVKQAPPPEPVAANSNASAGSATTQPVAQPKMTDEDKLKAVGDLLRPTGILEGAGRRLVTYDGSGGGTLEVGQSFSVTVQPDPTPVNVVIFDANDSSCILKLGNTTLPVAYFSKTSGASRAPSSNSPSPSKP